MWAMKLWDEGYKRVSREMLGDKLGDDSELVRGGSAGLAEVGNRGINMQGLSRSIANLVAPMPAPSESNKRESDSGASSTSQAAVGGSSRSTDTTGGSGSQGGGGSSSQSTTSVPPGTPTGNQRAPSDLPMQDARPSSPPPVQASFEAVPETDGTGSSSSSPREAVSVSLERSRLLTRSTTSPTPKTNLSMTDKPHSPGVITRSQSSKAAQPQARLFRVSDGTTSPSPGSPTHQQQQQPPLQKQQQQQPQQQQQQQPQQHQQHQQHQQQQRQRIRRPSAGENLPVSRENAAAALADSWQQQPPLLPVPGPGPQVTGALMAPTTAAETPMRNRKSSSDGGVFLRVVSPSDPEGQGGGDLEAPWLEQHADQSHLPQTQLQDTPATPQQQQPKHSQMSPLHGGPHDHQRMSQEYVAPVQQRPPPLQQQQQQQPQQQQQQQQAYWGSPLAVYQSPFQQGAGPVYQQQQQQALPYRSNQPHPFPKPGADDIDLHNDLAWGQLIGEGGFGKVYAATFKGQQVAVKVASREDCGKASVVEEFKREVSTMQTLPSHRHVLELLGACTTPPCLALVTEFCSLGSMYGLLHNPSVHLTWAQIIYMCLGAANGMVHLHRNNILHRDLKSANLLVDQDYTVKVADFGLSRVQSDLATMTGGLGTYQWMAPEVLGYQRYTDKADVYSFGIVLWECTARELPYTGMQGMPAAMAVMNRGLRPEIPAHTPAPLADLIRSCWRPIPAQRPTMLEAAATLSRMYKSIQPSAGASAGQQQQQHR